MGIDRIKLLDCTIRDGGLINKHNFDYRFVREVYKALCAAELDYIELGYKNSRKLLPPGEFGPWKFCDDADLHLVIDGVETKSKLSVMVDVGRVHPEDILPAEQSPITMIRVATYLKDIKEAIDLTRDLSNKGFETSINLMAISTHPLEEVKEVLIRVEKECPAQVIYIVDSFGGLYPKTTKELILCAKEVLKTKEVGFHGHNNMQLAFGNTLEAIEMGATFLDGTVFGIGRAAGNCPMELLLGRLNSSTYQLSPILDLISQEFITLKDEIEWGYIIPYALTGLKNLHPRKAIELRESGKKDHYREFFESF